MQVNTYRLVSYHRLIPFLDGTKVQRIAVVMSDYPVVNIHLSLSDLDLAEKSPVVLDSADLRHDAV